MPLSRVNVSIIVAKDGVVFGFADTCVKCVPQDFNKSAPIHFQDDDDIEIHAIGAVQTTFDYDFIGIRENRDRVLFDEMLELSQRGVVDR